jgi:alkyl sulfatase BDS1-like metallo-beta-lactamase superfamily hydrolase
MRTFLKGLGLGTVATALIFGGGAYMFRGALPLLLGAPIPEIPQDAAAVESQTTKAVHEAILKDLPFSNRQDFEFAARGFVATLADPLVKDADGKVVYDLASYDFLKGDAPATVNPSLWRQAQLITRHGLYKVTGRIYQVRGFDVSSVSFIVGDTGYIVVDPLVTGEAARAAFDLVKQHVGDKPVIAVIYSHSHADHFGGVEGIVSPDDVASGKVKIIAPSGFLEHAVSENIIAGAAMGRRARYQFGNTLPRGPQGEVTSGLGPSLSRGSISLIAPTDNVRETGQEMILDGVTFSFQMTPGTEAPAEMNFYLPQFRAVFMAENANATMHNVLTPRGALVRNAKDWADYLTQSIRLYSDKSDVMFAAHGIPRWGSDVITDFLKKHRDAYKFLHDQSVRLMNAGLTGPEIAEQIKLPDALAREWYNRGYYGTMSFNSKAVYQRYMGWYDANPTSLHSLPPVAAATNYIEAMGGADAVMAKAGSAITKGEYRWAAQLLNHVVFADPDRTAARETLADIYTQLGYQAEAGTWRNIYLTGAQELRHGVAALPAATISPSLIQATPTTMLLDYAAVRLNPNRAAEKKLVLNVVLSDVNEHYLISVENGVLVHEQNVRSDAANATVTLKRVDLLQTLLAGIPVMVKTASGAITAEGDANAYAELVSLIDPVDANFPIVTP